VGQDHPGDEHHAPDQLANFQNSKAAKILEAAMLKKGVRNVAWMFITRMSAYTSKDKPLIKPADFKGVKIRGLNKLVDSGLRALGAAPSAMSGSKVYQALATGVIDAGLTDISAAYSRKYYEVQKYVTVSPLFSVFFHAYVNPKWYDGLDATQKKALAVAGAKLAKWAIEVSDATAAKAPGQLKAKGMIVHIHTPAEIAAMKKIMVPAFDKAFLSSTGATGKELMKIMGK
jgi:TRAP-type C4-dicarboxylate transport system substrate-binding protein